MQKSLKQCGESDTKLKNSLWKSFRFEIVIYSLLSMFYTILTIAVILLGSGIIYFSLGGERLGQRWEKEQTQEEMMQNSSTLNNYANNSLNHNAILNNKANYEGEYGGKHQRIGSQMMVILIICVSILAIFLFIFYFLKLTRKFSTYMGVLTYGIDEIANGNFEYPIEIPCQDEFGEIAKKVNRMAVNIHTIMENDRRGEDRKHELITSVAHDLRTPLTSVIGYLELLRNSKVDDNTKDHYLQIVYSKSKRMEQLLEDLFSYTKYTYGNIATITEPVDIVKLLEQLVEEFYPSFEENKLTYEFYKDCSTLVSYADGNLLARAFANLIGNAIKYGVDGKRVELYFAHKSNQMYIIVKNYGTIIPQEDLPHIFERFYRVENSRSQETGGSGLGLAIAKSIVVMHHGEISAKSNLNGTIFEVKLPIIREPERI